MLCHLFFIYWASSPDIPIIRFLPKGASFAFSLFPFDFFFIPEMRWVLTNEFCESDFYWNISLKTKLLGRYVLVVFQGWIMGLLLPQLALLSCDKSPLKREKYWSTFPFAISFQVEQWKGFHTNSWKFITLYSTWNLHIQYWFSPNVSRRKITPFSNILYERT